MKVIILILLLYVIFYSNKEFFTNILDDEQVNDDQYDYDNDDFTLKKMSNLIEVICSQEGKPGSKNKLKIHKNEKDCRLRTLKQFFCKNYNDKFDFNDKIDFNQFGKGLCEYARGYNADYDFPNFKKLENNC